MSAPYWGEMTFCSLNIEYNMDSLMSLRFKSYFAVSNISRYLNKLKAPKIITHYKWFTNIYTCDYKVMAFP
jgi:hypothetical protein